VEVCRWGHPAEMAAAVRAVADCKSKADLGDSAALAALAEMAADREVARVAEPAAAREAAKVAGSVAGLWAATEAKTPMAEAKWVPPDTGRYSRGKQSDVLDRLRHRP
jgi:hypothetical protein